MTEPPLNPLRAGMRLEPTAEPCVIVIFGATGDLTRRKLLPALYRLAQQLLIPAEFAIIGVARKPMSDDEYRAMMREALTEFGEEDTVEEAAWNSFASGIFYVAGEFKGTETYARLKSLATRLDWEFTGALQAQQSSGTVSFSVKNKTELINLHLNEVQRPAMRSGRLAQIELKASDAASFLVSRSVDGLHLETHAIIGELSCPGRWLPVRNQSTAQLLSREMEILCSDKIYEEAIVVAGSMARLQQ